MARKGGLRRKPSEPAEPTNQQQVAGTPIPDHLQQAVAGSGLASRTHAPEIEGSTRLETPNIGDSGRSSQPPEQPADSPTSGATDPNDERGGGSPALQANDPRNSAALSDRAQLDVFQQKAEEALASRGDLFDTDLAPDPGAPVSTLPTQTFESFRREDILRGGSDPQASAADQAVGDVTAGRGSGFDRDRYSREAMREVEIGMGLIGDASAVESRPSAESGGWTQLFVDTVKDQWDSFYDTLTTPGDTAGKLVRDVDAHFIEKEATTAAFQAQADALLRSYEAELLASNARADPEYLLFVLDAGRVGLNVANERWADGYYSKQAGEQAGELRTAADEVPIEPISAPEGKQGADPRIGGGVNQGTIGVGPHELHRTDDGNGQANNDDPGRQPSDDGGPSNPLEELHHAVERAQREAQEQPEEETRTPSGGGVAGVDPEFLGGRPTDAQIAFRQSLLQQAGINRGPGNVDPVDTATVNDGSGGEVSLPDKVSMIGQPTDIGGLGGTIVGGSSRGLPQRYDIDYEDSMHSGPMRGGNPEDVNFGGSTIPGGFLGSSSSTDSDEDDDSDDGE